MNKLCKGMLAGAALLVAPFAQASTIVIEWDYTVTIEWTDANFTNGGANANPIFNETLISWGAEDGDHTIPGVAPIDARSGLEITDSPTSGSIFTNAMGLEETGTVTHFNNSISNVYDTLINGSLLSTLNLTPTNPAGDPLPEFSTLFVVDFFETPNVAPCAFPSDTVCDDIFVLELGLLDQSFVYNGITYFLTIRELSGNLALLPDATCAEVGAGSGCFGFTTPENAFTPIQFGFSITAVPEPAMLGMFGLGLLGLRAFGRRRLAKK